MKPKLVIFLLLVALRPGAAAAAGLDGLSQIAYHLEVFELTQSDAKILDLKLPEPLDVLDSTLVSWTRLLYSPSLIEILRAGAGLFQITAAQRREESIRLAQPQIIVALGETGTLGLTTEEWVTQAGQQLEAHHFGLKLRLTPLRLSEDGGQIFTQVELSTNTPQKVFTAVWTKGGELVLLGVLGFREGSPPRSSWGRSEERIRYFAVYLRADAVWGLPSEAALKIGSLGGLSSLLWQKEAPSKPSLLGITLPLNSFVTPEFELQWWLAKSVRLGLKTKSAPFGFAFALSWALFRQELLLQSRLVWDHSHLYLALGAEDQLDIHPALRLSAGIYPFLIGPGQPPSQGGLYWWAEVKLSWERVSASLKQETMLGVQWWEGKIGYRQREERTLFFAYRTDWENQHRFSLGYERTF